MRIFSRNYKKTRGQHKNILFIIIRKITTMATEKPTLLQRAISLLPVLVIGGLLLLTVGITLLSTKDTTITMSHEEEYWAECTNIYGSNVPCHTFVCDAGDKCRKCDCQRSFHLPQDIIGDVTLYYELGFDQTLPEYANSRDNDQLMGNPGPEPSEACGDYRYSDDGKPIYPCGKVADTMFTDVIGPLIKNDERKVLNVAHFGILTEETKLHYRNPPVNALEGFAEPKNWHDTKGLDRYWEIDTNNTGTGVENEAFQAWMNTNLKRKPVWRLLPRNDSHGLPMGNYTIRIEIHYFAAMFNGTRKLIFEGVYPTTRTAHVVCGSIALVLGIPLFIAAVAVLIIAKKQEGATTDYNTATLPASDRISHPPRTELEDISEESKLNKEVNGD